MVCVKGTKELKYIVLFIQIADTQLARAGEQITQVKNHINTTYKNQKR